MNAPEERYKRELVEVLTNVVHPAVAEVEAKCPRTRYALHKRLWWRVVGVLALVAAAPFVYLRLSWKLDTRRRRKERFWT